MKDLYYKTPTTRAEEPSIKALSEKVQRLEKALDEEHVCAGDRQHYEHLQKANLNLQGQVAALINTNHDLLNEVKQAKGGLEDKRPSTVCLEGRITQLSEESAHLHKTCYQMRNCGNCSEEYCDALNDSGRVQDCKDDDRIEWSLNDG